MNILSLIFLLFSLKIYAKNDLVSVHSCLALSYNSLKNYNSIVAAVVNPEDSMILTFGKGNKDQLFEIGSITKTMSGILLAKAVNDGKVKISDSIPDHYQKSNSPITYKHLATHTSGLTNLISSYYQITNDYFPYEGLTREKFKEIYHEIQLDFSPGEKYQYSNTGVALLGLLLEESYGKSFEALVQENIFNILGMKESYFEVPVVFKDRFTLGNVNGEAWPFWDMYKTVFNPAGGVRSTISDMVIYARANLNPSTSVIKSDLELSQIPLFQEDQGWVGMYWNINPDFGLIWHNGSTIAFNSLLVISKKLNLAVIMMTDTGWYNVNGQEGLDSTPQDAVFKCLLKN